MWPVSWGWIGGIVPYVIILVLIVIIYKLYRRSPKKDVRDAEGNLLASSKTSVVMLKDLYAKGEITHEEFEEMKKEIEE